MIFSIAFMSSIIYLRLEGKVPPPGMEIFFKHEYYRMVFSMAFMFSTIFLRMESKVPTPSRIEIFLNMNTIELFFYSIHA